jgi:DNA-binding transcriptional LysR family regulator
MWNQPIPELRLLQVFIAVSESGSMTAAARRLGLTQSAVSQALGLLERQLKVPLLDRERRPLQLTAAGHLLRERAPRLLEQAVQLPTMLQELSCAKLPGIRLGLVDSFAATAGPYLIRELLQSTMHLSVYSGLTPFHSEALRNRAVDLVVTSDSLYDVDGLERHSLLREAFVLIVPGDLAHSLKALTLDQIASRYSLIRYSARSHIGVQIERYLRRSCVAAPRTVEVDTSDTLVAMVAAGCGFGITTPLCHLQGRAHAASTIPLALPGPRFTRTLRLVANAGAFAEMPLRVAEQARAILRRIVLPEIRELNSWLADDVLIEDSSAARLPASRAWPP